MNAVLGIGLSIGLAFTISACSQAADVQLRGPEKPKAPTGDLTTPSGSPTPSPTPNGDSGPVDENPPAGENGSASEPVPVAPSYRLYCHDRYPSYLTVISSKASPSGFGSDVDLQVFPESRPLPVVGGFDSSDRNLEFHMFVQPIEIRRDPVKGTETRVVFSARPIDRSHSVWAQRNIYVSDVALVDRVGRATLLAPEMKPSSYVESLDTQEGVSAKTFGVSDGGKYLLVMSAKGLSLFDSKTLRGLGDVKWKLSSGRQYAEYFAPSLREADMTLAVSHVDSKLQVTTEVFELSLNSRGEAQLGARVLEVSKLRRPLVSVAGVGPIRDRSYYGLTGGKSDPATAEIVLAVPATVSGSRVIDPSDVKSFRVEKLPKKGRVPSAIALWRDGSGEILSVLGFEDFEQIRGGLFGTRYKIEAASLHTLVLDESRQVASPISIGSEMAYPQEVRSEIESGVVSSRLMGLKEIHFSPDRKALFALFPGSLSYQVYSVNAMGADRVSQEECSSLSIGVEK